jgi:hypothetical protein
MATERHVLSEKKPLYFGISNFLGQRSKRYYQEGKGISNQTTFLCLRYITYSTYAAKLRRLQMKFKLFRDPVSATQFAQQLPL